MKTKEFNLSEKIKELDLKIMNDEISLLVFLNLRNELDKEFIKKLKETFRYSSLWKGDSISEEINKLAGDKLI